MLKKRTDILIWSLISIYFILLAFLSYLAFSPGCAAAEPWEFNIRNDFIMPAGKDRFLTNAFYLKRGEWTIGNDMYSPQDKRSTEVDTGDRPWDGYSYIEKLTVKKLAFGHERLVRVRLGAVGELSGAEDLQKFIHNDLGAGVSPSWSGQNPSEITAEAIVSKRSRSYLQTFIGDTQLTDEYGVRFGNVNNSFFLDQEIRRHFFKNLYFYVGLRGDVVLYNTHLDGRMFSANDYTVNKNWFVATGRTGIELYFPRWHHAFVNYGYLYVTEEFEGQRGRHSYGSLTFGRKF